jgi:hypothetical protein
MINLDKDGIDFIAVHKSMTSNYVAVRANHFPTVEEMGGSVEFRVTTLMPLGVSLRTVSPKSVIRQRRLASQRLSAARIRVDYEMNLDLVVPIRVLNSAPGAGDRTSDSSGFDEDSGADDDPVVRGRDVSETIINEVAEEAEAGLKSTALAAGDAPSLDVDTRTGEKLSPSNEHRSTPAPKTHLTKGQTQSHGKSTKGKKSTQAA